MMQAHRIYHSQAMGWSALLAAAAVLFPVLARAGGTVDNGGAPTHVWLIDANWNDDILPTAADDVIFDNSLTSLSLSSQLPATVFALKDDDAAGDVVANSLTFGSASGSPLGALSLQGSTTGTTARQIALTTGAIHVHSSVLAGPSISSAAGTLTLTAGDGSFELTNGSSHTLLIDAILAGTNTSVTSSSGITWLLGANSYTGATHISGGTLRIDHATTFTSTSAIHLTGSARLDVAASDADLSSLRDGGGVPAGTILRYSASQGGSTGGPGTIFGTVELAASNIDAGYTLDFGTGAKLITGGVNATYGAPITLAGDVTVGASDHVLAITGSVTGSISAAKTLTLTGSNTSANNRVAGVIADGEGNQPLTVVKAGPGRWTLAATNTYSGGLTIRDGTVSLANSAAAGSGTITLGDPSGPAEATLTAGNGNLVIANPIIVAAGGTGRRSLVLSNTTQPPSWTGGITLHNDLTLTNTTSSGARITTGDIVLNGHTLTFDIVTGSNFEAGWTVSSQIIDGSAPGIIEVKNTNPNSGAILSAANPTLTSSIHLLQGRLDVAASQATGVGELSMADGTLLKLGFNNANIQLANSRTTLGAGVTATVSLGGSTGRYYQLGPIELGEAGTGATLILQTGSNAGSFANLNTIMLHGDSTIEVQDNRFMSAYGGIADDGGNYDLIKTGGGHLAIGRSFGVINGLPAVTGKPSTYGGDTRILAGSLRMGMDNALPSGTTVYIADGATLDLSVSQNSINTANSSLEVAGLNDIDAPGGSVTANTTGSNLSGTPRTLTLSGDGNYAFSGILSDRTGTGGAQLGLIKQGSGTQRLNGANTYSGSTHVLGGALVAGHPSALGLGPVEIESGGTVRVATELVQPLQISSLLIDGDGALDVGTGAVAVATQSEQALRSYLAGGYAGGAWNGPGLYSAAAAASGGTRSVGYRMDGAGAFVQFAAPGDTDLNGEVELLDLENILAASKFNTGQSSTWTEGDFNYDAVTDATDLQLVLASNTFNQGPYSTGGQAQLVPAAMEQGALNDGILTAVYDPATGNMTLHVDGLHINGFILDSASGLFTGDAANLPAGLFNVDQDSQISASFVSIVGDLDMGSVAMPLMSEDFLQGDLTLTYTVQDVAGIHTGDLVVVPEPAVSGLLMLSGLMLGRRRRAA